MEGDILCSRKALAGVRIGSKLRDHDEGEECRDRRTRTPHAIRHADRGFKASARVLRTCVSVRRPHTRPGPADLEAGDLAELAARLT